MSDVATLLPRNASPLERALDHGMAARIEALDAGAPARFHRPDTLPASHLPFLAWEMDVPMWRGLSEAARRALIAQSPDLHRLAGTLTGARRMASWAGGEVLRAVTRRNRAFAGPTLTTDERAAWLTRLPELRIYSFRERAHAHTKAALLGRVSPSRCIAVTSTARARFSERATMVRNGAETDLTVWTLETTTTTAQAETTRRVALPSTAREDWRFAGRALRKSTAAARLYTVAEASTYRVDATTMAARILPVPDELAAVSIGFERVAEPSAGNRMRHAGAILRGQAMTVSTAGDRLYRRARLADPAIPPAARGRGAYMTRGRLSPPAWRAELLTRAQKPLHPRAALKFLRGHAVAHDATRLDTIRAAIAWGQPAAADWRIDTRTRVTARAGIHLAGAIRAGQTLPVR